MVTRRLELSEALHGAQVSDPYRWLEDDSSDEVKAWVSSQNAQTEEFLGAVPERDALRARLTELFEIGTVSLPTVTRLETGEFRYFFTRRSGRHASA